MTPPTSWLATVARAAAMVAILTFVYQGSRVALVVALALGFVAHEITAWFMWKILTAERHLAERVAQRMRAGTTPRGVEERS